MAKEFSCAETEYDAVTHVHPLRTHARHGRGDVEVGDVWRVGLVWRAARAGAERAGAAEVRCGTVLAFQDDGGVQPIPEPRERVAANMVREDLEPPLTGPVPGSLVLHGLLEGASQEVLRVRLEPRAIAFVNVARIKGLIRTPGRDVPQA